MTFYLTRVHIGWYGVRLGLWTRHILSRFWALTRELWLWAGSVPYNFFYFDLLAIFIARICLFRLSCLILMRSNLARLRGQPVSLPAIVLPKKRASLTCTWRYHPDIGAIRSHLLILFYLWCVPILQIVNPVGRNFIGSYLIIAPGSAFVGTEVFRWLVSGLILYRWLDLLLAFLLHRAIEALFKRVVGFVIVCDNWLWDFHCAELVRLMVWLISRNLLWFMEFLLLMVYGDLVFIGLVRIWDLATECFNFGCSNLTDLERGFNVIVHCASRSVLSLTLLKGETRLLLWVKALKRRSPSSISCIRVLFFKFIFSR